VKNTKTSFLLFVEVSVGVNPEGHKKLAGQVTLLAVPSAVNINTNELDLPLLCTLEIVKVVMLAFNATSKTVAVFKSKVNVPDEIVGAVLVEDEFTGRNILLSSMTVVLDTFIAIFAPLNSAYKYLSFLSSSIST
jgi:hypothetical protein